MRSLSQKTRELWNENLKSILTVIFRDKRYYRQATLKTELTKPVAEFLLKGDKQV